MKNIVFDLGGVLFARDKKASALPELLEFSASSALRGCRSSGEYDRGTSTLDEVTATISRMTGRPVETCSAVLQLAIDLQEPVKPTERLVRDLKAAGYKLYVLSNMSREFIDFLRRFPVYGLFDGEVVSVRGEHREARTAHLRDSARTLRPEAFGNALHRRPRSQYRSGRGPSASTVSSSITAIPPLRARPCGAGCCNLTE